MPWGKHEAIKKKRKSFPKNEATVERVGTSPLLDASLVRRWETLVGITALHRSVYSWKCCKAGMGCKQVYFAAGMGFIQGRQDKRYLERNTVGVMITRD